MIRKGGFVAAEEIMKADRSGAADWGLLGKRVWWTLSKKVGGEGHEVRASSFSLETAPAICAVFSTRHHRERGDTPKEEQSNSRCISETNPAKPQLQSDGPSGLSNKTHREKQVS